MKSWLIKWNFKSRQLSKSQVLKEIKMFWISEWWHTRHYKLTKKPNEWSKYNHFLSWWRKEEWCFLDVSVHLYDSITKLLNMSWVEYIHLVILRLLIAEELKNHLRKHLLTLLAVKDQLDSFSLSNSKEQKHVSRNIL